MISYLILATSWFLLVESLGSIFYRVPKVRGDGWNLTDRRKVEFSGRVLRFAIASILLWHLFSITSVMMNRAGFLLSAEAAVAIAARLPDLENHEVTFTQKIEFSARIIRGLVGLLYLIVGLYIA